jgi:hypothetical protein
MTMTDAERRQQLIELGLNPDADSLAQSPAPTETMPTATTKPVDGVRWAPEGVDPHTMPLDEIVFTDDMMAGFRLDSSDCKAASDYVFAQYRSLDVQMRPRKDPVRHPLLHRKISELMDRVKISRKTGGYVREQIKANAEQNAIAKVLAAKGLTAEDLAELFATKEENK